MKKAIYLSLSLLLMCSTAQAQFLKNLKKKVEEKVENTITENVSDKAASETDKSLNKIWETKLENSPIPMGGNSVDASEIPEMYDFDWEYSLSIETNQEEQPAMDLTYHLKEDAPYFGIKMPQANGMFMVLDSDKKMTIMYLSSGENNFISASKLDDLLENEDEEGIYEDMEFEEIAPKTILGYECSGYKAESEDHTYTFYITEEAGLSFTNMYHNQDSNIPKGFDPDWLKDGKGLMMQMEMEDKVNPENNVLMKCTDLRQQAFSINKNNYTSIGG